MNAKIVTPQLRLIALIAAIAMTASPASAQNAAPADDVEARVSVRPDRVTVGDVITVTLTITHPVASRVVPPRLDRAWGEFEVRRQHEPQTAATADGRAVTKQVIESALFATGRFQTPSLDVLVVDRAGEAWHVQAAPAAVEVASVLKAGDDMPRDIKAQAELPVPAWWPWLLAGIAGTTLLATAALWAYRRRPHAVPEVAIPAPVVDPRSPIEIARETFDHIEALGLVGTGRLKEHYTLVADCVRHYIEPALGIPTLDRTTSEIRRDVAAAALAPPTATALGRLLDDADLVKFARWQPDADDATAVVGEARAVVEAMDREITVRAVETTMHDDARQFVATAEHDVAVPYGAILMDDDAEPADAIPTHDDAETAKAAEPAADTTDPEDAAP